MLKDGCYSPIKETDLSFKRYLLIPFSNLYQKEVAAILCTINILLKTIQVSAVFNSSCLDNLGVEN